VRERIAEVMFEVFEVPNIYLANKTRMVMYSAGRSTGWVLDIGEDATYLELVLDGFNIP